MWWLLLLLLFNKYKYKENSTWFEAIRVYKSLSQKLCHKAYTARVSRLVRNSHYSLAYTFKHMCTLTACLANENNTQTPSTTPTHTHRTLSNTAEARRTIQRVAFAQAKSTCYNNVYRVFSLVKLEWSGGEARAKRNRERDSTQPSGTGFSWVSKSAASRLFHADIVFEIRCCARVVNRTLKNKIIFKPISRF